MPRSVGAGPMPAPTACCPPTFLAQSFEIWDNGPTVLAGALNSNRATAVVDHLEKRCDLLGFGGLTRECGTSGFLRQLPQLVRIARRQGDLQAIQPMTRLRVNINGRWTNPLRPESRTPATSRLGRLLSVGWGLDPIDIELAISGNEVERVLIRRGPSLMDHPGGHPSKGTRLIQRYPFVAAVVLQDERAMNHGDSLVGRVPMPGYMKVLWGPDK
jgi:hypothetical protein